MISYLAVVGLALHIIALVCLIITSTEYINDDRVFILTVFGFGIVKAKDDEHIKLFNKLRKTKDKRWFIEAPVWFNRTIYNFGVVKDDDD